jgi:hypothetical protein
MMSSGRLRSDQNGGASDEVNADGRTGHVIGSRRRRDQGSRDRAGFEFDWKNRKWIANSL